MRFSPLPRNGSTKRIREPQLVDARPSKKNSPTPSDSESDEDKLIVTRALQLKHVLTKYKNRSRVNRNRDRHRHDQVQPSSITIDRGTETALLNKSQQSNVMEGVVTPVTSPSKSHQSQRIDSADRLAISLPITPTREHITLSRDFADLSLLRQSSPTPYLRRVHCALTHQIFQIPEILESILKFVSTTNDIPCERSYARRKPISYHHALLIYKDEEKAAQVWRDSITDSAADSKPQVSPNGPLFNCLLVNKLWHTITLRFLLEKIHFKDFHRLSIFIGQSNSVVKANEIAHPSAFVLHKFHRLSQDKLDQLSTFIASDNMKWLELYICPNVVPPYSWISRFKRLEKLVLPGNKTINDKFLLEMSRHLPTLKTLDLRACDNVTDSGIIAIAINCPKLEVCNLGRHRNGDKITSLSVVALAKHTRIETLGVAGCRVTDAGIWELAQLRGNHIRRLSLNSCNLLSNHSIPILFAFNYFPNLAVLEIRNIDQITDVRHLVNFKLWKKSQGVPVLIEGCERITKLMFDEESRVRITNSRVALQDMSHWVNNN